MSRYPRPTRKDHQAFCETEGWTEVRNATGKGGDHITYELRLPDGRIPRTRISHPPDRSTYGPSLWAHILRDQLHVTEQDFWACVRERTPPARGRPEPTQRAIPAAIVGQLLRNGVPESRITAMSRDEAIELATAFWSAGP